MNRSTLWPNGYKRIMSREPSFCPYVLFVAVCWYVAGTWTFKASFHYSKPPSELTASAQEKVSQTLSRHRFKIGIVWAVYGAIGAWGMLRCMVSSFIYFSGEKKRSALMHIIFTLILFAAVISVIGGLGGTQIIRNLTLPPDIVVNPARRTIAIGCISTTIVTIISIPAAFIAIARGAWLRK